MKVSIIIVNYNGKPLLEMCLKSLFKSTYTSFEVIVVDNASTDNSTSWLQKTYPKIKIVQLDKNKGFASANNTALQFVNGKYILFLNNDTEVQADFLKPLVDCLDGDSAIGGVQSKILLMKDRKRHDSVGAYFTNTGFLYHFGYNQLDHQKYNQHFPLYTAKGACMMFRKRVIDKVGLFDEDFFAYFEETDFCHRVWLAGYKILYEPRSVIYHFMGATSNKMNNGLVQFHSFKNRICSYVKNLDGSNLLRILPVHVLLCEVASLGFFVRGNIPLSFSIQKAILWNIYTLPNNLKKRNYVQRTLRVVADSKFLPIVSKNPSISYYISLFAFSLRGYVENE